MSANPSNETAALLSATFGSVARAIARDSRPSPQDVHAGQSHLIAIVAHELRGPLMPIRNTVELLKRAPLDAATVRSAAEVIERQVIGMMRLIDDLVDVSHLTSGNLEIQRQRVSMRDIVERCVEIVGTYVSDRGHKLLVEIAAEPVFLVADGMRVCQSLQNLVTNAAKYTNNGGEIRIRARRDNGQAVFEVSDTGIGIAADQLEIIFDMFAQDGQAGSRRSEGGLGIGLFLTRNLVEAHGGAVVATSAGAGFGSQFTVRLPCENPHDGRGNGIKQNGSAPAGGRIPF
jgi:signal transduction histidine kinase